MATEKKLKIQASSISRIMKCPGSCTLESKLPDRLRYFAYKDAAEYGTACHLYGENILNGVKQGTPDHPRAEEIIYTGTEYAKAVKAGKIKGGKLHVEEKFRAEILGIDCVAKSDAFYVAPGRIRKFDLKSGRYDYTESATAQMSFAANLFCFVHDLKNGTKFDAVTIQPNYFNEARRVVASSIDWYEQPSFVAFVAGIKKRQKEFNAGSHCKMCAAILTCKTVKKLTEEFFDMAKKANKDDLNFREIYEKKDAVIAFLDAIGGYLKNELETGKIIPGLYLEEYSGHRKWINAEEVAEKLAYLKDKIFEPRKLKTPAQVEKIAGRENVAGLYDTPRLKRVALRTNNFEGFAE